ncbi:MAG: iron-sulfur cluster assembly accessory protein [Thermoflexus sp.]|jgi:iron-sulfur cluster assembly accessory protein|nr:iron-sulfur cluster assembly accessory protein [Thermoflexus sp.]
MVKPARQDEELSPRVPLVTLTEAAARRLQDIIREKNILARHLRVFVASRRCCGLQYGIGFEDQPAETDHRLESQGIYLLVDPISASCLWGSIIDYIEDPAGGFFRIHNPNALSSCGSSHSSGSGCGCGSH